MKVLAHIREQYGLSLSSYGRPRMTMELKEVGLDVGELAERAHKAIILPNCLCEIVPTTFISRVDFRPSRSQKDKRVVAVERCECVVD